MSSPALESPRTNATAIVALLAAVAGFCFWGIGGIAAILLGLAARAEIARSSGREGGATLAAIAIALGAINLLAVVVGLGVSIALFARPSPLPSPTAVVTPFPVMPRAVPSHSGEPSAGPDNSANATYAHGVRETVLGKVRLIDISAGEASLRRALETEARQAKAEHEKIVLFVVTPNCLPCNGVALALRDRKMQAALDHVRLIRLDAREFAAELSQMGVPIETIPGFALLAESLRPTDYVHGGEWDADIAENIAPVLGAFVRGKYTARRHPRREAARPDETAL